MATTMAATRISRARYKAAAMAAAAVALAGGLTLRGPGAQAAMDGSAAPTAEAATPADSLGRATALAQWPEGVGPNVIVDKTCNRGVAVAYTRNQLLVSAPAALPAVLRALPGSRPLPTVAGITPVTFVPPTSGSTLSVVSALRQSGLPVSLRYQLLPSPIYGFFPSNPPQPATALSPTRSATTGSNLRIAVLDTGLLAPADRADGGLTNTVTSPDSYESWRAGAPGSPQANQPAYPHAAHGTAIASVLRTLAPGARVQAWKVTDANGLLDEVNLAGRVFSAAAIGSLPQLLNLSFGTYLCRSVAATSGPPPYLPALAVQVVGETVAAVPGGLLVAAAGNDATTEPVWPAAYGDASLSQSALGLSSSASSALAAATLGVGALNGANDGDSSAYTSPINASPLAAFSNAGSHVKAWAPGWAVPVSYLKDADYPLLDANNQVVLRHFEGMATWQGSSFAAPYAAARVAEVATAKNLSPRQARQALLAAGQAPGGGQPRRCVEDVTCSTTVDAAASYGGGVSVALTTLN